MDWMIAVQAIWLILPAYIANSSAVILGGGTPIDFGKKWRGRRLLGDGKTWRGFFGGIIVGMIAGLVMNVVAPNTFGEYPSFIFIIFSLSCGALLGDIAESFIKRQMGKERGEKWILFDQLDFLIGAFIFSYIMSVVLEKLASSENWFYSSFTIWHIISLLIFTPLLHYATNVIGYLLKLKKVPW